LVRVWIHIGYRWICSMSYLMCKWNWFDVENYWLVERFGMTAVYVGIFLFYFIEGLIWWMCWFSSRYWCLYQSYLDIFFGFSEQSVCSSYFQWMYLSVIFRKVVQTQFQDQGTFTKRYLGGKHSRYFCLVRAMKAQEIIDANQKTNNCLRFIYSWAYYVNFVFL